MMHAYEKILKCLESVDSAEGRRRVRAYLKSGPYPHFEAVTGARGLSCRIDANGQRTIGRFIKREFRAQKRIR